LHNQNDEAFMKLRLSKLTITSINDWLGAKKEEEDDSIVHKGWLQKQSRKYKQFWNERYFVLSKGGTVIYYASTDDATSSHAGGATFGRIKWEHVADVTKKEDFQLKTMEGELIMKLRLSQLSTSSIEDWLKGNQWLGNTSRQNLKACDESFVNHPRAVPRLVAPASIVYENEQASFSVLSEPDTFDDSARMFGNPTSGINYQSGNSVPNIQENQGTGDIPNERDIILESDNAIDAVQWNQLISDKPIATSDGFSDRRDAFPSIEEDEDSSEEPNHTGEAIGIQGRPKMHRPGQAVSTVDFAGVVTMTRSEDDACLCVKSQPSAKPGRQKGVPKLVSQWKDRFQLDGKARRKQRREKMKEKKRESMNSCSSMEGVVFD